MEENVSQVREPDLQQTPEQKQNKKPKKKKRIGLIITLSFISVIILIIAYLLCSLLGVFAPKDLGVKYTEADYQSVLQKTGISITFDGMSGDELREYTKQLKKDGKKLNISDYNWEHSDYQQKKFELTSEEATAFLNEVAPGFYWIEDQQIKVLGNGKIETSGKIYAKKVVDELAWDVKDQISMEVPEKINVYTKGSIEIKDNKLTLNAEELETGVVKLISPDLVNENAVYGERLYTYIPGVEIYSLTITDDGKIAVDALIPQKTVITKKP